MTNSLPFTLRIVIMCYVFTHRCFLACVVLQLGLQSAQTSTCSFQLSCLAGFIAFLTHPPTPGVSFYAVASHSCTLLLTFLSYCDGCTVICFRFELTWLCFASPNSSIGMMGIQIPDLAKTKKECCQLVCFLVLWLWKSNAM